MSALDDLRAMIACRIRVANREGLTTPEDVAAAITSGWQARTAHVAGTDVRPPHYRYTVTVTRPETAQETAERTEREQATEQAAAARRETARAAGADAVAEMLRLRGQR